MSILDIQLPQETITVLGKDITLNALTYLDLYSVWNKHKASMIAAYDAIVSAKKDDPVLIIDSLMQTMPDALLELVAIASTDGGTFERQPVIDHMRKMPIGILSQLVMGVYRVSMTDADVLKKSLESFMGEFKKQATKTPMPEDTQALQAQVEAIINQ